MAPSRQLIQAFDDAGGAGKPRYAQIDVCVAETAAEARRIAHRQWTAPAAVPPRLLTKLRVPADFEDVAELITEEQVGERVLFSPDPDAHVAKIEEFLAAGFDHVHIHQVRVDQETFLRFYEQKLLPRLRELHG